MEPLKPGEHYRCAACGNRSRFDVTENKCTTSFYHFTVGAELIEVCEVRLNSHTVEEVICRWCGHGREVEVIKGPDTE